MKPDAAETVYEGALISVTRERWGEHEREIVEHPGSVSIVAVDDQSRVVLVRQLREPARRHLLELPAEDEQVELVRWPVDDISSRLQEIDDAKTLIGLLLLLRRRN